MATVRNAPGTRVARTHPAHGDQAWRKGAVEPDRPADRNGRTETPATPLTDEGLPGDDVAIAQDVLGANADQTQG